VSGDDARFRAEALKEARKAEAKGEVPVGAVVVKDGKVVARGHNLRETLQDPLAHAEAMAVRKAAKKLGTWRLEGCAVYVTLEPCPMCAGALSQARVKRVVYGAADPKGGAVSLGIEIHGNGRLNHRYEMALVAEAACGEILTAFFRGKRQRT
jgi:tRNA(adenine34) deaminase